MSPPTYSGRCVSRATARLSNGRRAVCHGRPVEAARHFARRHVFHTALLQELCLNYNPRVSSFITLSESLQRYAPEVNRRMRPHLKMSGASYRLDETYAKVGAEWKYLYRAVDSAGCTIHLRRSVKSFLPLTPGSLKRTSAAAIPSVAGSPGTRPHCRAGASASIGR